MKDLPFIFFVVGVALYLALDGQNIVRSMRTGVFDASEGTRPAVSRGDRPAMFWLSISIHVIVWVGFAMAEPFLIYKIFSDNGLIK